MDAVWLGFEHGFGYSTLMRLSWRTKWLCDGGTSAAGSRLGADLGLSTGGFTTGYSH